MKYKELTLDLNYEKYSEYEESSLNGYKKNKVYYTLGEFYIYVDFENLEYGKQKLLKSAENKYKSMIKNYNTENNK